MKPNGALAALLLLAFSQSPAWAQTAPHPPGLEPASAPALSIAEGSVAHREIVALGRDVVVRGEARSDVAVLRGSARISGSVAGSVIVLSGDAFLESGARIERDVYVLGGRLDSAPGAVVRGRAAAYPTASAVWLTLLEGPALGLATNRTVLVAKLALLVAWALALLAVFAFQRREVITISTVVSAEPFQSFFIGLSAVFSAAILVLFLIAALPGVVAAPLVALVGLAAVAAKVLGLVACFHAFGALISRRRRLDAVSAATLGLLLLGALKLVPFAGSILWTVATLIGLGAALATKLGRNEPWLAQPLLDRHSPIS